MDEPAAAINDYAPDLDALKRLAREAIDITQTARNEARTDRKYYDGKQIGPEDERVARVNGRPLTPENHVRLAIDGLVGILERGKTDPRGYPRNPQDEDAADVASKTLRYSCEQARWNRIKQAKAKSFFIEGTAAVIVEVNAKVDPVPRSIHYDEFFYDPRSRELDFSDAAFMGVAKWMDQDKVVASFPEKRAEIETYSGMADGGNNSFDVRDRPDAAPMGWNDPKRKRMLVVEMYHLAGGVWRYCAFVGGLLLAYGDSPYMDDDDDPKPCNPIEAVSAYIDDENNRYGRVRDLRGPQDGINKRITELLARAGQRQVQEAAPGMGQGDPDEVRKEAAKVDGVIPSGWQLVPQNDIITAHVELLRDNRAFMERSLPAPEVLGRQSADSSGRAQLVRQQAGLTELADLYGALEDWELRVMRQIWARIRQYWTMPKFARVTNDEKAIEFVQLNEPVYEMRPRQDQQTGQVLVNPKTNEPVMEPVLYPQIDPNTGMPAMDPQTRQIMMKPRQIGVKNSVASMSMDIIVDTVPDTANIQAEQFAAMIELAKIGALGPKGPLWLLKSSSLSNKREILDDIEGDQKAPPPPPPPPDPLVEAKIGDLHAGAELKMAKAYQTVHHTQTAPPPHPQFAPAPQAMPPLAPTAPNPQVSFRT